MVLENDLAVVLEALAVGHVECQQGRCGERRSGCARAAAVRHPLVDDRLRSRRGISQRLTGDAETGDDVAARWVTCGERGFCFDDGFLQAAKVGVRFPKTEQGNHQAVANDPEIRGGRMARDGLAAKLNGFCVACAGLGGGQAVALRGGDKAFLNRLQGFLRHAGGGPRQRLGDIAFGNGLQLGGPGRIDAAFGIDYQEIARHQ